MPAIAVSLKVLGDWRAQVSVPLKQALATSMKIIGRTGEEACRHAIILMARSASKLAKKAAARRTVLQNNAGAKYVEVWKQRETKPNRLYKFQFETDDPGWKVDGTWANAQKIGHHGLAKRSWMWGLAALNKGGKGPRGGNASREGDWRGIPGVTTLSTIRGETANGYILTNRLPYIDKVMPAGWEMMVEHTAGVLIMKAAERKLEREFERGLRRREQAAYRTVSSFFKAVS